MSNDLFQSEFIIKVDGMHIKPMYDNTPAHINEINTYPELIQSIEKTLKSTGMDILYLCQIINDCPQIHDLISSTIYNAIRKYIETDMAPYITKFWTAVAKEGDSSHEIFKKRKFPSVNVRDKKWKMIMCDVNRRRAVATLKNDSQVIEPTVIAFKKDYPKDRRHIVYLSNKEKQETNYDKIKILPIDQYNNEFTNVEVLVIFKCLHILNDPGLIFKLWCKLIMQYETVHLVLYNKDVWNIIISYIDKKNVCTIISYCMFYGLFILSKEELISPIGITTDYRFIVTHDIASSIPQLSLQADINPWNTQIVGSEYVSSRAIFHLHCNRKLTSPDEFKQRFRIITNNAFKGINLKEYDAVVVGSSLIPCAAKNELEQFFMKDCGSHARSITDHEFECFINYYYPPESEIDASSHGKSFPRDGETIPFTNDAPSITDIDIGITSESMEEFIQKAIKLYDRIKINKPNAELKECASVASLKFTIVIPGERWIEMFQNTDKTNADMIWRFHLSVVKMYWNGENLWMFKSCISSLLTGICDSYGWVSCNKSAAEIVLKYAQRGYSTCINFAEEQAIIEYMKSNNRWNIWDSTDDANVCEKKLSSQRYVTGTYSKYHRYFHPGQIKNGIGLRYGMCNDLKKLETSFIRESSLKQGVNQVELDDTSIRSRTTLIVDDSYELRFRNTDGTNIIPPDMHCINSVSGKIFM